MKYCDDANCPNFEGGGCALGFELKFRVPKSYSDVNTHNWGYIMPKVCRYRLLKLKAKKPVYLA